MRRTALRDLIFETECCTPFGGIHQTARDGVWKGEAVLHNLTAGAMIRAQRETT